MAKVNYHIISGSTYDVLSVCKFRYQLLNRTHSIHVLPLFCLNKRPIRAYEYVCGLFIKYASTCEPLVIVVLATSDMPDESGFQNRSSLHRL